MSLKKMLEWASWGKWETPVYGIQGRRETNKNGFF